MAPKDGAGEFGVDANRGDPAQPLFELVQQGQHELQPALGAVDVAGAELGVEQVARLCERAEDGWNMRSW